LVPISKKTELEKKKSRENHRAGNRSKGPVRSIRKTKLKEEAKKRSTGRKSADEQWW